VYGDERQLKARSEPELHELVTVLEASLAAARDALVRKQLEHVRAVEARRAAEASAAEVQTPRERAAEHRG
jgi:hypothetical protein